MRHAPKVGRAMALISSSDVWAEYARVNPRLRLRILDLNGMAAFQITNPLSHGFSQVFVTPEAAITFAHEELLAMELALKTARTLTEVQEALEQAVSHE